MSGDVARGGGVTARYRETDEERLLEFRLEFVRAGLDLLDGDPLALVLGHSHGE